MSIVDRGKEFITNTFATVFGFIMMIGMLIIPIGAGYWLFVAGRLNSIEMFIVGVVCMVMPLLSTFLSLPLAIVGAYMFFYGPPVWVIQLFG